MKAFLLISILGISIAACAQQKKQPEKPTRHKSPTQKPALKMDLSKIANEKVRTAIEALQANDKQGWYTHFTEDAVFTDDGRTLGFQSFFDNAFDKKERFLSIDKIENEGKDIYGNFFAGQWGTFKVFFKFHQNADGRFNRLDIGQTK